MTEYTIPGESAIAVVTANTSWDAFDADGTQRIKKVTAAQLPSYLSAQLQPVANFRNVLDGGDFTVNPWQRGTSFSGVASTLTYTADRWFAVGGASSSISVSRQAQSDVAGFSRSLRWGRGAGTDTATINLGQVLETADSIRLQGATVAFSFWAKAGAQFSALNSALTVQVISGTGTDQSAANMVAGTWTGQASVINTTQAINTAATRYSFTGTVGAAASQLGVLVSYAPTGTNNTTDTVDFYGFQLEVIPAGTASASPFEHRDVQVELEICQRYFWQINEPSAGVVVGAGMNTGASAQVFYIATPVQLRTAPTVTVSAGSFKTNQAGTATATTITAGSTHTPNAITINGNSAGTAGQGTLLQGGGGTGTIAASADY
jgi:hypothetical protein